MDDSLAFSTLVELVQHRARALPDQRAYTVLAERETDQIHLTYGQLDREARAIGARLQRIGVIGERVLLLYPDGIEYVTAFLGCLYAGAIPIPAYPPRLNRPNPRIEAITADAQARFALTTASIAGRIEARRRHTPELQALRCLGTTYPEPGQDAGLWEEPPLSGDSLAYIQYTSGSTATPRGVMLSHNNLIRNLAHLQHAFQIRPPGPGISWLPLYHDMGLIGGVLLALYVGGPLDIMSSTVFAQDPVSWLKAITRYKGTVSGGPNFAYQLCVDRVTPEERTSLDLSSWQVALCGAEPIHADTLRRFAETFAPCGFRPEAFCPSYGLAEATLLVSAKSPSVKPTIYTIQRSALERGLVVAQNGSRQPSRTFVGCGQPLPDHQVAIIDPESLVRCAPDRIGEIWVSGPSVAQGYWNRLEETGLTFQAFITQQKEGPYLRTGDLGFLKDGELVITGRLKDLIIIRGRNYDPYDIEAVAQQSHPALEPGGGAAFSMPAAGGEERLAIVHELRRSRRDANVEEVARAIRRAVAEHQELPVYAIALARPGVIPRTSSGKTQRYLCREAFLAGQLETIAVDVLPAGTDTAGHDDRSTFVAPRTPLEMALAGIWTSTLGREHIGTSDNFFELGGDSLSAARMVSHVREAFAVELSLSDLLEAPTVAGMSARIEAAKTAPKRNLPPIERVDREDSLALSFAQERMWFLNQLQPRSSLYNLPAAFRVTGALDVNALRQSLNEALRRHEALRTIFVEEDGRPLQTILPEVTLSLPVQDLQPLPHEERELEAERLVVEEARRPFDLTTGPLVRALLLRLGREDYILLVTLHHIVCDGWSAEVLVREVSILYGAFSHGAPSPLPELPIQYVDYAAWQRRWMQDEALERQLVYWQDQVGDSPPVLELPTDHPRTEMMATSSAHQSFVLPTEVTETLEALARREGTTVFVVLLSAFQALLSRYTGEQDICVGTHSANRGRPELEGLVGLFINTLAIRTDLSGDPTFRELVGRAHQVVSGALDNQDVPFETILDQSNARRRAGAATLFQIMFVMQKLQQEAFSLPGLSINPLQVRENGTPLDLTLVMSRTAGGMRGDLQYNADLFDAETIARMSEHFQVLLESAVAVPENRVSELPLLTKVERHQVLSLWNRTAADYATDRCFHELFDAQAAQTPDAVAVALGDQRLTYDELNRQANQLAHHLRRLGVSAKVLVGLCVERSVEMIVGLLGILKAGGAYVPLDPNYPPERLAFMLADTGISLLLTQQALADLFLSYGGRVLCLDTDWPAIAQEREDSLPSSVTPKDAAYVIYTSGSTGKPKGVLLEHRGLCNVAQAQARMFGVGPGDRILQYSSISFDAATSEITLALSKGATLCLGTEEATTPGCSLAAFIQQERVTAAILSPSVLAVTPHEDLPDLRMVMAAGEACPAEVVARWAPGRRFFNLYGPTETTIWAAAWEGRDASRKPPIGRPIANLRAYVLDAHLQPVPIGVSGELYIGGVGLARGYLHRPQLTAERFIADPFSSEPGARLYRTGDRVRYLPDGNLDFLGRLDDQIKMRGLRIEPGEIEAVLAQHEAVEQVVVVAREEALGDRRLVAYVVPGQAPAPTASDLHRFLRSKLPEYMVPSTFVILQELPLTLNGKVDRAALPAPEGVRPQLSVEYSAPRTPVEETLAGIWAEVLGVERVGIHDSFFELGGHSLLATQVASRVRELFQVELPLRAIFATPTVEALAARVADMLREGPAPRMPPIQRVDRSKPLPLSFAQERMWFLHQLDPESSAYNICGGMRLVGWLDPEALQRTFEEIVRRHEAFRTTFTTIDGHPVQVITPRSTPPVDVIDLRSLPSQEREDRAMQLAEEEARRPFDLTNGPPLRVSLLRLGDREHILLFNMHHIVSDAWSLGLLTGEILKLYRAHAVGEIIHIAPLSIQYADFAVWQREWLRGEALEGQLAYWRKQLDGAPVLELPTDYPRPVIQHYRGALISRDMPGDLLDRLKHLSNREGVTLFMTLLSAFEALLYRYTGQEDIAVAVPVANRNWFATEGIVGSFVNTVVMRIELSGDPTFRQLLQRVREVALGAYAHQDMPYAKLVAELQPERDTSHVPLAQVAFNVVNVPISPLRLGDLQAIPLQVDRHGAQFDLNLTVTDTEVLQQVSIEYDTDLFREETIRRLLEHLLVLWRGILTDPEQRISSMPLLTDAELQQLIVRWNDTAAAYPQDACIHHLFEEQARRHGAAVALRFQDQELTYEELDQQAERLAYYLQQRGVGPETLVGLCVERSPAMLVGLLGVLKAGAGYLPLDPTYPRERLAFMLEETRVPILLTLERLAADLPTDHFQVICLDRDWGAIAQEPGGELEHDVTPENVAYVIYTSGSTGKPKGVVIPHRAVVNFLSSMGKEPGLTEKDVLLAVTSLSFDIAVLELFLPLSVGAQLELVSRGTALDGQQLSAQLARSGATVMQATPVTWRLLVETGWQGNLQLKALCGGEALPRDLASELLTRCGSLWNMYGPTETTVWSTVSKIEADKSIDIGRPIDNTQVYILDEHLQPVPVGIAGELYIGGLGLARGYLNDPELTAAQFIPDPFSDVPNARLYKTGDLARYLPDGNIEWLGRRDRQVKIRGFRIELGEVEATLRQHPAVADAAAIVLGRHDSGPFSPEMTDRRLAAYVVPKRDHTASTEALRTFLGDRLPSYMIPATWASVDALPLTPNGKLDRRALAELEQAHVDETHSIVLPRDALERQMVEIWEQVLEVRRIGVRDSFFELGGHSLLAVRLFAQVEQRMKIKLPVATLFRSPTVERLCEAIRTGHALGWKAVVPIQIEGSQPPLFCVHGLGGGVLGYAELARLLGRDQPFYGLQARGLDGAEPPHTRIEEMAAYYVEAVRTVRPAGPYRLGGYSFGGVVAFEMARQLHAQGAYVDLVALFDTYAPLPLGIESQLWRPVALARFLRNLPRWLGDILRRQDGTQRLRTRIRLAARAAWRQANPRESAPLSDALVMEILGEGADATEEHRRVLEAHLEALESYRPQIYPGRVTLFRVPGMRLLRASDDAFGWGKLAAGGVTVRKVTGAHYSILESPAVEALAAELRDSLHEAREPQPDDLPQPDR